MAESPKVPSAQDVANKWASRIQVSSGEYSAGVNRTNDWQQKTAAGNANYKEGVARAAANDSFLKGVNATSNSDWQQKAASSSGRWTAGASAAKNDMAAASAKVLASIAGASMPDRGPRGSEGNYERVRAVGKKLHDDKLAGAFQ